MEIVFKSLLATHIAAGSVALLTGLVVILMKKGSEFHKKTGRVYYYAMLSVACTAFVMSLIHHNDFLFMLAFLSFFLVYTGFRAHRQPENASIMDYIILVAVFSAGAWRFAKTFYYPWHEFSVVPVFFSIGCMFGTVWDFIRFRQHKILKSNSMVRHITRILGSYVAAITAFLVVNFRTDPVYILWLAPTVIGSVLITIWVRRYK